MTPKRIIEMAYTQKGSPSGFGMSVGPVQLCACDGADVGVAVGLAVAVGVGVSVGVAVGALVRVAVGVTVGVAVGVGGVAVSVAVDVDSVGANWVQFNTLI